MLSTRPARRSRQKICSRYVSEIFWRSATCAIGMGAHASPAFIAMSSIAVTAKRPFVVSFKCVLPMPVAAVQTKTGFLTEKVRISGCDEYYTAIPDQSSQQFMISLIFLQFEDKKEPAATNGRFFTSDSAESGAHQLPDLRTLFIGPVNRARTRATTTPASRTTRTAALPAGARQDTRLFRAAAAWPSFRALREAPRRHPCNSQERY